jgi:hypothetical protein
MVERNIEFKMPIKPVHGFVTGLISFLPAVRLGKSAHFRQAAVVTLSAMRDLAVFSQFDRV